MAEPTGPTGTASHDSPEAGVESPCPLGLIAQARQAYEQARVARATVHARYQEATRRCQAVVVRGRPRVRLTAPEQAHAAAVAVREVEEAQARAQREAAAEVALLARLLHEHDAAEHQQRSALEALVQRAEVLTRGLDQLRREAVYARREADTAQRDAESAAVRARTRQQEAEEAARRLSRAVDELAHLRGSQEKGDHHHE